MKLAVVGTGYVGLVSGTCFSELGNEVIGVDIDQAKIDMLNNDVMPIYEPGLKELVVKNKNAGRLSFTTDLAHAIRESDIIFIAVGTPSQQNGEANLEYVYDVAREIGKNMNGYKIVVDKSTVPVGTGDEVAKIIRESQAKTYDFDVVSSPEFLREGSAIKDTMEPDRIVVGSMSEKAAKIMAELHQPFNAPIVMTDIKTAEMIKYASNAFLAVKISFINEIANICERVGADVTMVADGMGYDRRIGRAFLNAGIGFGGSCFPKDTSALVKIGEKVGYSIKTVTAAMEVNDRQRYNVLDKLKMEFRSFQGKKIGLLGLAFKPNTDDMRYAPSIDISRELLEAGAVVKGYDPVATEEAKKVIEGIEFCSSIDEAVTDMDAVVVLTEWNEFGEISLPKLLAKMQGNVLIDGRNVFDYKEAEKVGFRYHGVGRYKQ